jgi:hypothetical protein
VGFAVTAFPARKIAGVAGVVLLHVAAITALLHAIWVPAPRPQSAHEHIVWLILHEQPKPAKASVKAQQPRAGIPVPRTFYPDYRSITLPPATGETDLSGIHGSLFNCAPENLVNLSPDERAQCAIASTRREDDTTAVMNQPSRTKNPVRWARAVQRKQNPTLLPCMPPGLWTIICAANAISHRGFDLDMQPSYGDKPEHVGVPNGGDPPDALPKQEQK